MPRLSYGASATRLPPFGAQYLVLGFLGMLVGALLILLGGVLSLSDSAIKYVAEKSIGISANALFI
jgi:hypothetical protein